MVLVGIVKRFWTSQKRPMPTPWAAIPSIRRLICQLRASTDSWNGDILVQRLGVERDDFILQRGDNCLSVLLFAPSRAVKLTCHEGVEAVAEEEVGDEVDTRLLQAETKLDAVVDLLDTD